MKKCILLILSIFIFNINSAFAEIISRQDQFTNKMVYVSSTSQRTPNPITNEKYNAYWFEKCGVGNDATYSFKIWLTSYSEFSFKDIPIEIKIDDLPVITVPVKNTWKNKFAINEGNKLFLEAVLPFDVVNKIKTASRVAIRCFRTESDFVLIFTDDRLNEWKTVINIGE
ncbi:MAG: hypothetical protein E6713_07660 [Sporomusaceae bacterium]|nr:hypothetical protein [Sporomusaceae bacterium]